MGYSGGTGEVLPYRVQCHSTKRCTGMAWFLRFRAAPTLRACAARTQTRPLLLRPSLPPARSTLWAARVLPSADVRLCRSLARASSRSTWCVPVTGVPVVRVDGAGALCHYCRAQLTALVRSPACGSSVVAVVLPNQANSSSDPRVRPACLPGTLAAAACGYSLPHRHSGILNACSIKVPSWHVLSFVVPCACGRSDAAATHA